ncbi:hypothetical protein LXL04_027261 [Taraxacum kok-saghyz]
MFYSADGGLCGIGPPPQNLRLCQEDIWVRKIWDSKTETGGAKSGFIKWRHSWDLEQKVIVSCSPNLIPWGTSTDLAFFGVNTGDIEGWFENICVAKTIAESERIDPNRDSEPVVLPSRSAEPNHIRPKPNTIKPKPNTIKPKPKPNQTISNRSRIAEPSNQTISNRSRITEAEPPNHRTKPHRTEAESPKPNRRTTLNQTVSLLPSRAEPLLPNCTIITEPDFKSEAALYRVTDSSQAEHHPAEAKPRYQTESYQTKTEPEYRHYQAEAESKYRPEPYQTKLCQAEPKNRTKLNRTIITEPTHYCRTVPTLPEYGTAKPYHDCLSPDSLLAHISNSVDRFSKGVFSYLYLYLVIITALLYFSIAGLNRVILLDRTAELHHSWLGLECSCSYIFNISNLGLDFP